MDVILYTRAGCPCCTEAEQTLMRQGLSPTKVDIDSVPHLQGATCAPVVEIDGKIRFRGRVDALLLRRLLQHRGGS